MAAAEPARKRTPKRTKQTPTSENMASISTDKPADLDAKPALNPAKLVRKGRKPSNGARLRRELTWPKASHGARLLITQAARLADRLEQIGRLLDGDANAWLAVKVAGTVLELDVAAVVREERQLSEVLRKLIGDIQKMRADENAGKPVSGAKSASDPLTDVVRAHYGRGKRA